jgi:hypothetical protein
VPVLSKVRHRGAVACHVSDAGELPSHGAAEGGIVREETGVVYSPHKLMFVCELNTREGRVFFVEREMRSV